VVIPCRNEEEFISKCLDSIVKCDFPKDELLVFVCDGMSDDNPVAIINDYATRYSWINLLCNEKRTTPFALNLGIKSSNSKYVTILGAHAEVGVDYFSKCVEDFSKNHHIGCTGGLLENVYDDEVSAAIGFAQSHPFGVGNAHFRTGTKAGYVDTVAFGTYRRQVFLEIGYFDEELVRNQDDEFNFRLLKSGFKIWLNTTAHAKYFVRGSINKLWRQYFQYGYWKVFVNRKHRTVTTLRQLIPSIFVLNTILFIVLSIAQSSLALICFYALGIYLLLSFLLGIIFTYKLSKGNFKEIKRNFFAPYLVMASFFTLHFSYGIGYLKGLWQFLILRKTPSKKSESLTR